MSDPRASERTRARLPWLILAAVGVAALAFGIGRFTALAPAFESAAPATDSAEAGFARDMQVHHDQAVEMAMQIHAVTDDPELRILAYDIATAQAGQRGEMSGWLVQWGLPQLGGPLMEWMDGTDAHGDHGMTTDAEATEAERLTEMGMATDAELRVLAEATGTEADCLFLDYMIRHHTGAVPMADALLELGTEPRVRQVATAIRDTQSAEITRMTAMQSRLGCAA